MIARGLVDPGSRIRQLLSWLRSSPTGLAGLALVVGVGAGLGAVAFRAMIGFFTWLLTARTDYSLADHSGSPHLPWFGSYFLFLAPVLGGLVYGPLVDRFAREARGHGVPEVMLAVAERGGRIRPQVSLVKALASAVCIGSGGSVGREGPIVQIGSALGSTLGQLLGVPESRLRILVACGAAAGISATFNAPIAGVFFALELILVDFAARSFGVVVLASVAAAVVGRTAFGSQSFLALPHFEMRTPVELVLYALLGVVAAATGVGFIKVLYGAEDIFERVWRGPEWLRPAAGGLLLGGVLFLLPEMYGVGYPVLEKAIGGGYATGPLLLLLVGKIVAVSLTIAIGGSGGVFAPSLFMGAMLGTAFGALAGQLVPGTAGAGAYGLVGMGAVFAAASRAPITAVIIVFELTGEYSVILPLMFAVVVATGLSHLLTQDTIYTLKLRRRGIEIRRGEAANVMEIIPVEEAMRPVPMPVASDSRLNELVNRFAEAEHDDALPVIDSAGAYAGVVTRSEVEAAARANALDTSAGDLAESAAPVYLGQSCADALSALVNREEAVVPVVDRTFGRPVGWLGHRDVLRAYNRRLQSTVKQATRSSAPPEILLPGYRLVDLELKDGRPPVGKRISEVSWPPESLVLAVRRGDRSFTPQGGTVLEQGDRLVVLAPAAVADELPDRMRLLKPGQDADGGALPA